MSRLAVIICIALLGWEAQAQVVSPELLQDALKRAVRTGMRTSASGQFIIHDVPPDSPPPLVLNESVRWTYLQLNADVLVASCENLKRALLTELRAPDEWRGRISIFLHRARRLDEFIVIGCPASGPDWAYYLDVPDTVNRERLTATLVNMMLLERANRGAERCAEIPAWLGQGFMRELTLTSPLPLMVMQPQKTASPVSSLFMNIQGKRQDPLRFAHEALQKQPPLTLEELSWPLQGQEETEAYRGSAQLLVHQLLGFPDGRDCLRAMLQQLPRNYNWQTSFLQGFQSHFATPLEFEKWWALQIVSFTGRDLTRTWPPDESWRRLEEVVRTTVEVRTSPDEMPMRAEVSLQNILRDWEMGQQFRVLEDKSQQLFMLRASVSQDLILLVDDYRQALEDYMKKREKAGFKRNAKLRLIPGLDDLGRETARQFDRLDARLQEARPLSQPGPAVASGKSANR